MTVADLIIASEKGNIVPGNIDPVVQILRKLADKFSFYRGEPIGQQILLLGESFYGYRFTSREYIAVWSAADNVLNLFDRNGKHLDAAFTNIDLEKTIQLQSVVTEVRRAA
ncbi:MAG: hypothetical protein FWE67_04780 [Planctomycetaceae bacterium]|nr:hypothetical protein [Planctomycetaceae bacterium]